MLSLSPREHLANAGKVSSLLSATSRRSGWRLDGLWAAIQRVHPSWKTTGAELPPLWAPAGIVDQAHGFGYSPAAGHSRCRAVQRDFHVLLEDAVNLSLRLDIVGVHDRLWR